MRKHKSTEIRKKEIVDAARKLIIKYGSEHVTVKRIAKEVKLSETAIYRHFKNKKDILLFLIDNIEETLLGEIQTISATKDTTALDNLETILKSHISLVQQRYGVSFQVIAEILSLGDKKLNKKVSSTIKKYIEQIMIILEQGVRKEEIKDNIDLEAIAIILFGSIQGLVNIWALDNYEFDLEHKYNKLWNVFHSMISK